MYKDLLIATDGSQASAKAFAGACAGRSAGSPGHGRFCNSSPAVKRQPPYLAGHGDRAETHGSGIRRSGLGTTFALDQFHDFGTVAVFAKFEL
jgi:hypothetical protein